MKNIHILPTDKPSRLFTSFGKLNIGDYITERENTHVQNQNIYITSDEEIKEGDWILNETHNIEKAISHYNYKSLSSDCKKIILTTNQDLIEDGVQAIDDEFLEWFVKNPSCEVVEVEDYGNIYNFRYLILIPKENPKQEPTTCACGANTSCECESEEPKQETLDEAAESYTIDFATWSAFKLGAKWQSERTCKHSYTLTSEQGHRVIKCSKCNDTQPI